MQLLSVLALLSTMTAVHAVPTVRITEDPSVNRLEGRQNYPSDNGFFVYFFKVNDQCGGVNTADYAGDVLPPKTGEKVTGCLSYNEETLSFEAAKPDFNDENHPCGMAGYKKSDCSGTRYQLAVNTCYNAKDYKAVKLYCFAQ